MRKYSYQLGTAVWLGIAAMFLAVVWGGAAAAVKASPAFAEGSSWTQPAGGCDETWKAPRSAAADECRAHGWTVRWFVVVGPRGYIRAVNMEPCELEDGSGQALPCFWNAGAFGNGRGDSFYITRNDRTHYVAGFRVTGGGS